MKIRFVLHHVYGAGGGVLRVVLNLIEDLKTRHDAELVSVLRRYDEATRPLPEGVPVTTLVDMRGEDTDGGSTVRLREGDLAEPSQLIVASEPRYKEYSRFSDDKLSAYISSVDDGVLVGMQPGIIAAIAQLGRPSVVRIGQEHRPFTSRAKDLRQELLPYYAKLDMFLTLTQRDMNRYVPRFPPGTRVGFIPNGIPEYVGKPSDHTNKVVVAAGRLKRGKGFDRLVTAWKKVAQAHPDWELRIFGEGKLRPQLEQQIQDLGVSGSARLMGFSTSLAAEMAEGSLFVLSSRIEGYPMVLVEAMASGLPVVSFDCPTGPREIIAPDQDGFLVQRNDIDGLADGMNRMIEIGEEGRRKMGDAALEKARAQTQPVISARWEQIFQELLAAKSTR